MQILDLAVGFGFCALKQGEVRVRAGACGE